MAQVSYSKEQMEYIEAMEESIRKAKELKKSNGWVVAGFAGDTYYCYVGERKGFNGSSPFFPMSVSAVVFSTEKQAQDHCYTGWRNGNGKGDLLDLHPVKASEYFDKVIESSEKSLSWAKEMWSKNVGRM